MNFFPFDRFLKKSHEIFFASSVKEFKVFRCSSFLISYKRIRIRTIWMISENIESHIIYFFTIEKIFKNSIAMLKLLIEIVRKSVK